jgi:hypothetical protein
MAFECLDASAFPHVPKLTGCIDRARCAILSCELKQCAADFFCVALKPMDWFANSCVPNDGSFVKRTCQDHVAVGVEMQRNQLTFVAFQGRVNFPHFDVPELCSTVH